MPTVTDTDLARMRDQLFVEGAGARDKRSKFWMLLVLAAIIAGAGVMADSTATVIGAMIVAPLMTPILGMVLAISVGDRTQLGRNLLLVLAGAALVVAVGFLLGLLTAVPVVEATNSQVAARVSPRLIDLVAALATGAVGSFALLRSDISDTLPGVAIAISLVPPLAVVGLTAEAGAWDQAAGALLLFTTNVAAILATGLVVMGIYKVHLVAIEQTAVNRRNAALVVAALVVLVVIPLTATSVVIGQHTLTEQHVSNVADDWASAVGWEVVSVKTTPDGIRVRAIGPGRAPATADLRARLDDAGLAGTSVQVETVPVDRTDLPGS